MRLRDLIDLWEGLPQGGTLYHATDVMAAARILDADAIQARTDHMINRQVSKPGVSLTRSFRFAVDWKRFGVIFALEWLAVTRSVGQTDSHGLLPRSART